MDVNDDFGNVHVCRVLYDSGTSRSEFYFLYVFGGKYFDEQDFPTIDGKGRILLCTRLEDVPILLTESNQRIRSAFDTLEERLFTYNVNELFEFVSGQDPPDYHSEALDCLNAVTDFAVTSGVDDNDPELRFVYSIAIALFETSQLPEEFPKFHKSKRDVLPTLFSIALRVFPRLRFVSGE